MDQRLPMITIILGITWHAAQSRAGMLFALVRSTTHLHTCYRLVNTFTHVLLTKAKPAGMPEMEEDGRMEWVT